MIDDLENKRKDREKRFPPFFNIMHNGRKNIFATVYTDPEWKKSKIQSCFESEMTLVTFVKGILKHTDTLIFCSWPQNYTTFYLVKTR